MLRNEKKVVNFKSLNGKITKRIYNSPTAKIQFNELVVAGEVRDVSNDGN